MAISSPLCPLPSSFRRTIRCRSLHIGSIRSWYSIRLPIQLVQSTPFILIFKPVFIVHLFFYIQLYYFQFSKSVSIIHQNFWPKTYFWIAKIMERSFQFLQKFVRLKKEMFYLFIFLMNNTRKFLYFGCIILSFDITVQFHLERMF